MKKITTILTLVIFLISLLPISIAQDLTDAQKDRLRAIEDQQKEADKLDEDRLKALEDAQKDRLTDAPRPVLIAARTSKEDLLNERKFADLRQDRKDRFSELREEDLNKFKDLKKDELERFGDLKKERLDRLKDLRKEELDRIKHLSTRKLEKVSKLSKSKAEKLSGLRQAQITRLTEVKETRLRIMTGLDAEKLSKIADLDARQIEKLSNLDRSRLEEISKLDKREIIKRLEKIKIKKVDSRLKFKKRIVSEQRIKQSEERFEEAKERLNEAKEKIKERKRLLIEAREAGDDDAIIDHAKNGLLRAADARCESTGALLSISFARASAASLPTISAFLPLSPKAPAPSLIGFLMSISSFVEKIAHRVIPEPVDGVSLYSVGIFIGQL